MDQQIRDNIEKLTRFDNKIQYVTVTLDVDAGNQIVEILAKCHRSDLVAEAKGSDMYKCIDSAFAKLQKQVRRLHDRLVSHKKNRTGQGPTE